MLLWRDGIENRRCGSWPGRMAAICRICFFCSSGVLPSLGASAPRATQHRASTYTLAFKIQSRSSSPSSGPPRPPRARRNSRGCQSTPSSARFAASSLCMSSILDFSSVATSCSLCFRACVTLCHSFCDSRSYCSSSGRAVGGVSLACVASNRSSFLPV